MLGAERSIRERALEVHGVLGDMIDAARAEADEAHACLDGLAPDRLESAQNLTHYLALRRSDRRELQKDLMSLGLSSLGRSEPAVLRTLSMTRHAAARLVDPPMAGPDVEPMGIALQRGRDLLDANTDALLGPRPSARTVRVMVTMPSEAASDAAFVTACLERGMDAARINTAHDSPDEWRRMVSLLRTTSDLLGRPCRVFADLGGPKIRTTRLRERGRDSAAVRFHVGDHLLLRLDASRDEAFDGPDPEVWCDHGAALGALAPGHRVWFDDGKIGARVDAMDDRGARLVVESAKAGGQNLRRRRGLNLPDTALELRAISHRDLEAIDALADEVDAFCLSFVREPEDVTRLIEILRERTDRPLGVVLKIETGRGFENLPGLLLALMHAPSGGVMIARGDLAVEVGFARLAEVQEEILWLSEAAHTPVIWATEVLSSLAKRGVPARAEITDAAMAQRAECVMLNKGPQILRAVESLGDILSRMESHQRKKMATLRPLRVASPAVAPG